MYVRKISEFFCFAYAYIQYGNELSILLFFKRLFEGLLLFSFNRKVKFHRIN